MDTKVAQRMGIDTAWPSVIWSWGSVSDTSNMVSNAALPPSGFPFIFQGGNHVAILIYKGPVWSTSYFLDSTHAPVLVIWCQESMRLICSDHDNRVWRSLNSISCGKFRETKFVLSCSRRNMQVSVEGVLCHEVEGFYPIRILPFFLEANFSRG